MHCWSYVPDPIHTVMQNLASSQERCCGANTRCAEMLRWGVVQVWGHVIVVLAVETARVAVIDPWAQTQSCHVIDCETLVLGILQPDVVIRICNIAISLALDSLERSIQACRSCDRLASGLTALPVEDACSGGNPAECNRKCRKYSSGEIPQTQNVLQPETDVWLEVCPLSV